MGSVAESRRLAESRRFAESRRLARRWTTALVLALLVPFSVQAQTAGSLDGLFTRMRGIEGLECHFREEKHIALLSRPLVSEGTIHYVRPGRMARRTTAPSAEVMLIEGSSLRMWDGSREQSIDLSSQPVVRSFIDSILALLAGDRAALERSYTLTLAPAEAGLVLTLTPRGRPLDQFLRAIRFTMSADYDLLQMEMDEVSGDTTVTTFSAVNDHRHYSASELASVFALH